MSNSPWLSLIGIIAFVYFINIIFNSFRNKQSGENKYKKNSIGVDDFKLRPSLMNSNERIFFEQLKLAVGEQFDIYPQTALSAIFQPIKQLNNWGELNKLNKRIDFVLFDKNTQIPKVAIELDGDSHLRYKSLSRDEFVGQIFAKFNIPLVRFTNGHYSAQDIKKEIDKC